MASYGFCCGLNSCCCFWFLLLWVVDGWDVGAVTCGLLMGGILVLLLWVVDGCCCCCGWFVVPVSCFCRVAG